MSNITITNKTQAKTAVKYTAGQYYRDRTSGDVYILAMHSNSYDYSLICLRDGASYSLNSTQNPIGAFYGHEADFDLIENVEIVLS